MPYLHLVWPPGTDGAKDARRRLLDLAAACVGNDVDATHDRYPEDLDALAARVLASPEDAKQVLEAAATLIALAVGRIALDDEADFLREFDEVDFVLESDAFARSVEAILSDGSWRAVERPSP